MGTLTSGSIDLNSLKVAGEPNKYITKINDNGITVHAANNSSLNYVAINANGMEIFKSNGASTPSAISVASFGGTVRIGATNTGNVIIQSSGMDIYGGDGTKNLAHIGYDTGNAQSGTADAPFYTFGTRQSGQAVGNYSVSEGVNNKASGYSSHAEGSDSKAVGQLSHAEGWETEAVGTASHTEGQYSYASGLASHAEGEQTYANGNYSHAEGYNTIVASKSGGSYDGAHSEGYQSRTAGIGAHAEGIGTKASSNAQHAQGAYNVEDTNSTYADIVGWGTADNARKNIFALSTSGDGRYKGDVYVGCNNDSTGGNKLSPVLLSGIADNQGCVTIGDLIIEWGLASITTSSSGTTTGGLTQYLGTAQVTFTNTFAYKPNVLLTWSANYNNQSVLNTYDVTTTGFYAYGRTLTGNTTRSIRWIAIGKKAKNK